MRITTLQGIVKRSLLEDDYPEIYSEFCAVTKAIVKLDKRITLEKLGISKDDEVTRRLFEVKTFDNWIRYSRADKQTIDDRAQEIEAAFRELFKRIQKYRNENSERSETIIGVTEARKTSRKRSGLIFLTAGGAGGLVEVFQSAAGFFVDAFTGPWFELSKTVTLILFSVFMAICGGAILYQFIYEIYSKLLQKKIIEAKDLNKYQTWLISGSVIPLRGVKIGGKSYKCKVRLKIDNGVEEDKAEGKFAKKITGAAKDEAAPANSGAAKTPSANSGASYAILCQWGSSSKEIDITQDYLENKNWWKICEEKIDTISETLIRSITSSTGTLSNDEKSAKKDVKDKIRRCITKNYVNNKSDEIVKTEGEYDFLYEPYSPKAVEADFRENGAATQWVILQGERAPFCKGTEENDRIIPINYFFEYAVIDQNGKNAKNHFLVFPERYNDDNGDFLWRVKLVVRDWNLAAIYDGDYREYLIGKIGAGKPLNLPVEGYPLTAYDAIEIEYEGADGKGKTVEVSYSRYSGTWDDMGAGDKMLESRRGACVLYNGVRHDLFKTHKIKCIRLKNKETNAALEFYISINFYPKAIVEYKGKRNPVSNALQLSVPKKVPGYRSVTPYFTNKMTCPYCGRIVTYKAVHKKSDKYCYREPVELEDEDKTKVYVCSHNFVGLATDIAAIDKKFPLDELKNINDEVEESVRKAAESSGSTRVRAKCVEEIADGHLDSMKDKRLVLGGAEELDGEDEEGFTSAFGYGATITILGNTKTGKSTFISRLFGVGEHANDAEGHSTANVRNALKPYVKDVYLHSVFTLEMRNRRRISASSAYGGGISAAYLRDRYVSKRYGEFLSLTDADDAGALLVSHMPLVLKLEGLQGSPEKSWLSFYDIPGTFAQQMLAGKSRDFTLVYRSNCWILLLNGAPDAAGSANLNLKDTVNLLSDLKTHLKRTQRKPVVAVVLCKSDVFFQNSSIIKENEDAYKYLRTSPPVAKATKFGNSARHKYIKRCSAELERFVKEADHDNADKFFKAISGFKHCYFAVSAIGRADSVEEVDDETKNVFETNFSNMENVLIWLMYMTHIID